MPRTPILIRHPDELDSLSVVPGFRTPGRGRIRLEDAGALDPGVRGAFEIRLNRLYFACGCDKAAFGTMLGLIGYIAWLAARGGGLEALGWHDLWLGLAAVVAATTIGKLIGRLLADRAFHRAVGELKRTWNAPARPTGPVVRCG